jgi:3-phenylpropionate/trans-cinnamate dioxygenase ferredoxin component
MPLVTFYDAAPDDWIAPGETAIVEVDGWPVGIANVEGTFFAFQALCPHQGTRLGGVPLDETCFVTCPQHGSRYDVTSGTCVRPSREDGFNQDLITYEVRVVDSVVQVMLD